MEQQQNTKYNASVPEKVFGHMVKAGNKTYFMDVKKATNGSNYLTIAESYKNQKGEKVINRILLFKDHFAEFMDGLEEVKKFL